jgi:hypothetical protein
MNCPKCGVENPVGDFCGSCGQRLTASIQTTPEMLNKQKGESRKRTIKIIAIVVVAVAISIFILSFAPILSEKVVVTIHSDRPYNDVHYLLIINGDIKAEGDLAPGGSDIVSFTLNYPIINEGKTAIVSAAATDGAYGDFVHIMLQEGSTQSVIMSI